METVQGASRRLIVIVEESATTSTFADQHYGIGNVTGEREEKKQEAELKGQKAEERAKDKSKKAAEKACMQTERESATTTEH